MRPAAAMMRGLAAALAGVARALLLEELLGRAIDLGPSLGLVGAQVGVRHLAQIGLVHERLADRGLKDLRVQLDFAQFFTGQVA